MHEWLFFPELVKLFYTNMSYEKGVISSSVKGILISFDIKESGRILDIPSEGLEMKMNKTISLSCYVKTEFYYGIAMLTKHEFFQKRKKMFGGKLPERKFWSAWIFYIEDKLLHYISGYVILPKISNHSIVIDTEMQLLFSIKNGIQVN